MSAIDKLPNMPGMQPLADEELKDVNGGITYDEASAGIGRHVAYNYQLPGPMHIPRSGSGTIVELVYGTYDTYNPSWAARISDGSVVSLWHLYFTD